MNKNNSNSKERVMLSRKCVCVGGGRDIEMEQK